MSRLTEKELALIVGARMKVARQRLDEYWMLVEARRLQSETLSRLTAPFWASLARWTGLALLRDRVVAPIGRALRRGRTAADLRRLDDHLLRDIGLERVMVESVAEELTLQRAEPAPRRAGLFAGLARWWRRRATIAELEALNDHVLEDIGLRREQIPSFVAESLRAEDATPAPAPSMLIAERRE